MAALNTLPVELILDIVKELVLDNENRTSVGENASWTSLTTYHGSLKRQELSPLDESDPLPRSPYEFSIYEDLCSLRLTCSALNAICVPFIYKDIDVIEDLKMPFEEFYDLILVPYAQYAKTVRLSLDTEDTVPLSDDEAAKILMKATNMTELLIHHSHFIPTKDQGLDWMQSINRAIVHSLEHGNLEAVGIYSNEIVSGSWWRQQNTSIGTDALLSRIALNPAASASLKRLDLAIYSMSEDTWDRVRQHFTSLKSMVICHALRPSLGRVWSPYQSTKWFPNSNLTHMYLKKCSGAYAPHIPHLVRHFTSLVHLLVSICGDHNDITIMTPPTGWYTADNALWKVRQPLDVFHLEHMVHWEIGAMGDIPTKCLIIANLYGPSFNDALQDDVHYFPHLQTIRVEPQILSAHSSNYQFPEKDFKFLEDYCQKRGVTLLQDAKPTSPYPPHY